MNEIRPFNLTIGTGKVGNINTPSTNQVKEVPEKSFKSVFEETLKAKEVTFSKHAQTRLSERNISLTETNIAQLNNAVKMADAKGLKDTLVLMDKIAFIVNVPSSKVITTLSEDDVKGNVFTNIDGAVII